MERTIENRILSRLKEEDEAIVERAYAILDNPRALKVLSVWELGVHFADQTSKDEDELAGIDDLWEYAWRHCEVAFEKIAAMTDQTELVVREEVQRLQDLRLVYPDGSKTRAATQLLRSLISAQIGKSKKPKS